MKLFAFLLASVFILQVTTPALCMTGCVIQSGSFSTCSVTTEESCSSEGETTCCEIQEKPTCCAAKMNSCTIEEENEISETASRNLPCNTSCVPCCSVPLCCCFYQDVTEIDFSADVVSLTKQLPSSNGIPVSGYLAECFQPPETFKI